MTLVQDIAFNCLLFLVLMSLTISIVFVGFLTTHSVFYMYNLYSILLIKLERVTDTLAEIN